MDVWRALQFIDSTEFIVCCWMEVWAVVGLVAAHLGAGWNFSKVFLLSWVLLFGIFGHAFLFLKFCVALTLNEEPIPEFQPNLLPFARNDTDFDEPEDSEDEEDHGINL